MSIISGFGQLIADGEDIGRVEFKIMVSEPTAHRYGTGRGTLYGDPEIIGAAFNASSVMIARESDGYQMGIVVVSIDSGSTASISTTGDPKP